MIYLDNNATTAIDARVANVIAEVLALGPANASSQHAMGRAAQLHIDEAFDVISQAVDTTLDRPGGPRFLFTSGGTESNNLALAGLGDPHSAIILSRIEHPSVISVAEQLASTGREIRWMEVDSNGVARIDELAEQIQSCRSPCGLVSLMSANNETGVLQPIEEAAVVCRRAGVLLHVDATQSIGKVPFSLRRLDAAAVTLSAHKFHGPVGIGGLWLGSGVKLRPLFHGGPQQLETRPGTEPVALISGMAAALQLAVDSLRQNSDSMMMLRDELEGSLLSLFPDLVVHGASVERLPNTSCVSFPNADRQSMLMSLDFAKVACSSGAACSSGSSPPSHVLQAMKLSSSLVQSALRFSLSRFSRREEIVDSIDRISRCYKHLGRNKAVEN
ncbi:cysteine desulfurase family protein [Novipirellula artificiosorum]|uniref:Cysteine desulfurase n=1 Tax=Novipirellula artificiosorum TaxID=2528016 RepID=A0A5C6DX64_9BACT|nr:cysteine desulfurase family protein [Novipirellula artificiosorum]TWU40804.1 Cysteine desulfurase [Novipirellula artificiosorum]